MLCAWFTSMISLWRAVTLHLDNMSLRALTICTNGWKWESRVFKQCGAQITQANNRHTGTWGGFEISFTEYVKKGISIITLPSHRRRDKKSKITSLELSQLRALNGQLLWLGMQCLPQLLAPLSLLMRQTPQATVGTIYEVNRLARKATAWARTPLKNPCSSFSCCGHVHRCWMDHSTKWHLTRWTVGLHCKLRVAARQTIKHVSDILAFESIETGGKIFICSRNQAAADGDDEAVHIRLCLNEVLFGQLDVRNWQSEARQIPAVLVVDCRGVYDALARSPSSCVDLKDKKSGLEALALKPRLVECGTTIRWCHSAAQLGHVVTKDSDATRAPWELFVRRGFCRKLIHDTQFESSRNRAKREIDTLDEPHDNEFADDVPRDLKSATLISWNACRANFSQLSLLAHLFWTLVPCIRSHWFCTRDASLLVHQKPLIPNIVMTSYQFRASWCLKLRCWLRGDFHFFLKKKNEM